ncbi:MULTISPECIES: TVP38/TMEM64 family protein [unclassified Leptolyngbya]|uniref:TVP38/TMEM64 family protein n=1 Tax=unclassified Leptolyngbya TaxID=2650499 RepID=UPI001683B4F0|nr:MULTISPECIES: TVP38/TMEM64 family protein [unclassified Leptolyngbya]MBD1909826.1 TVP38/TMEM64 family protein [Leptolyngbya sp. FACHB-8]MBD2158977.1 TVP38/TMEM64 family protein [Leptolyngbya sp. FACHB-16]
MKRKQRKKQPFLNRQNAIALAILLLCLLIYTWFWRQPERDLFSAKGLEQAIQSWGWRGVLAYISILMLSVVISPIPSAPLAVVAGMVWGPVRAGIYSVIGGFLGGLLAYFIGYTLGRSVVYSLTGKLIYFSKNRGEIYLGWIIFITRLLPVLSFDLISYGAGISGLSLPIYATATLLGMIPSTFFLTFLGATFVVGLPLGIIFSTLFLILLFGLPYGIHRYNWFNMRDIIRFE